MTFTEFHDEVAQRNMEYALRHPGDVRALVNAVLTLDALAGVLALPMSQAVLIKRTKVSA